MSSLFDPVFWFGKICIFLAVFFTLNIGEELRRAENQKLPALEELPTESEAKATEAIPLTTYRVVTTRNIFGAEAVATPATAPTKARELSLRLVGTSTGLGPQAFAIVEDTAKNEQDVFDLGEMVFNQARLVEILDNEIKLKRGEELVSLTLEEAPVSTASLGTGPPPDDQTSFTVAEAELAEELSNLPRLLSQARAVPYFRNGQSIGMRLFAIRRGSLYEKLGLKNGDIVISVNDQSLSDPAQALKLFEQLRNERSVSVNVERAGQEVNLRYSIQ